MKKKWGNYKVLAQGKGWKLKLLTLNPFAKTSKQKHFHRSEFWVFLGKFPFKHRTIGITQTHRLENKTWRTLKVLELQFGNKCIEKDIYRFKE